MVKRVSIPPPGFEDLNAEEKFEYLQDLWDYVAADSSKVPVPEWHRRHERLAEYHATPDQGKSWPQVRDQLMRELAEGKRGRG